MPCDPNQNHANYVRISAMAFGLTHIYFAIVINQQDINIPSKTLSHINIARKTLSHSRTNINANSMVQNTDNYTA